MFAFMLTYILNLFKNSDSKTTTARAVTTVPDAVRRASKDVIVTSDDVSRSHPYKTNSANQNSDRSALIRIGMTTQELVKAIGPALTRQYDGPREIWSYLNLKGSGIRTHIAIQNGVVLNWQDIHPQGARRFGA